MSYSSDKKIFGISIGIVGIILVVGVVVWFIHKIKSTPHRPHHTPTTKVYFPSAGTYHVNKNILGQSINTFILIDHPSSHVTTSSSVTLPFEFHMTSPLTLTCPSGNILKLTTNSTKTNVSPCISQALNKHSLSLSGLSYDKRYPHQIKAHLHYKKVIPLTLTLIKQDHI